MARPGVCAVSQGRGRGHPGPELLRRWFDQLVAIKRQKVRAEPELFATYRAIFAESSHVVTAHVETLAGQVCSIIADGVRRGEFVKVDPKQTGRGIFYATARFHDPSHAADWSDPAIDQAFEDVWTLIIRGLLPANEAKRRKAR